MNTNADIKADINNVINNIINMISEDNENTIKVNKLKEIGYNYADKILKKSITKTEPGSLKYLLWGEIPSEQSLVIKWGHAGEEIFKEAIKLSPDNELLSCGVKIIDEKGKKKDFDLLWSNNITKTIYIRECKGNIELDSEKLPATFEKVINDLVPFLKEKYPGYVIDFGILNWSIYSRNILKKTLSHIKTCEKFNVKVDHTKDFLDIVGIKWDEDDYYNYFRKIGNKLKGTI